MIRLVSLLLAGLLAVTAGAQAPAERFDLLISGGRVFDGTGAPWRLADVGLRDGRIAAVGDLAGAEAARVIDAAGLYVAPGFIDGHSHAGPRLATAALSPARPLLAQGITTVVVNPDGGGPVDLAAQRAALEADGLGVNVAQLVPHGAIREAALGMDDRAPTAEELEAMRVLVRRGMEAGAFGLSSGVFYAPGSYATTAELVALAEVAAAFGGVYTSHIRDESDYSVGLLAAVDEVTTVARAAGLPGIVTHIKALGPPAWGLSTAVVRRIERARAAGVEVYADQYPYSASATGLAAALVPRWAMAGGRERMRGRLRDPALADTLRAPMAANLARRGGADRIQIRRYRPDPDLEGHTLAAIAGTRGQHPLDTAVTLMLQGAVGIVSFNMEARDVATFMQQPWMMTASDGGLVPMGEGVPHPRNYGTFPRKLAHYARDEEVVSLEQAILSMTWLPAQVLGIPDRGLVHPGWLADLVVFDLEALDDLATYQEPHQLAAGMRYVLVGGELAVDEGDFTDRRAGRVLQKPGAAR